MSGTNSVVDRKDAPGLKVFDAAEFEFRRAFNNTSFSFAHNLAGHPLFELPRLATLAQTVLKDRPGSVRWQVSDAAVDQGWNVPLKDRKQDVTEAIANLDRSGSWVLLYSVQSDPEYAALLDQVMKEIDRVTGTPLGDRVTWKDAYIFLASPFSVTPYHIDHESTFLFQVHGERQANIWDANDRLVLTEPEIEKYYVGDHGAAVYKEANQEKATVYALAAGLGVHHPVRAPHWFKNGETYSVAMGVHFCLRDYDLQARVYQVNHCLRLFGLKPTPPGRSPWRDRVKVRALGLFSKRHPRTKFELLRSGFMRVTYPLRLGRDLKRKVVGR